MATMASRLRLLRTARNASLASRTAAAAASRSAAMASRSARAAAAAAAAACLGSIAIAPLQNRWDASTEPSEYFTSADFEHLPDDAKTPTDKDLESDEGVWALYERWCKAFEKDRDHAEMARRFKKFRHNAEMVHHWNTHIPEDAEEAAIYLQKREEAKLRLSKGEDVSDFEEWHLPMELGPFADGADPLTDRYKRFLQCC